MWYFANVNVFNEVINVISVDDKDYQSLEFPQTEEIGISHLADFTAESTFWKQTCTEGKFRYRYAGIGYEWHPECGTHGGFCPPRPYDDWVFDQEQCLWKAPKDKPGHHISVVYIWNPVIHDWERCD